MAMWGLSVIYPNAGCYAETSKNLRARLPKTRLRLKENVCAISQKLSSPKRCSGEPDIENYLEGRGMRLSIRAGMESEPERAKRLRLLACECLVESAFLLNGKPRIEILMGMKDALSKSVAAFEEETPKIAGAGSLLSCMSDPDARNSLDQDARGTLLYVFPLFGIFSDMLKDAGLRKLSEHSSEVYSGLAGIASSLNYRKVDGAAIKNAKTAIAGIHSTAAQLLAMAESVLASIEECCPRPKP